MITFACAHCGAMTAKPAGAVNRARGAGLNLFCGRVCSGLYRRKHKTKAQKVSEKAAYDAEYRARNLAEIKAKKAAYFRRTYDPAAAAEYRKSRMPKHVEYCRRPEYRKWKAEYDRRYLAEKHYGPFAEAAIVLHDLQTEILTRMSRYEIGLANQTICKAQRRRREHESLVSS